MGMANSDDDSQIMNKHYLMEEIKKMTPEYAYQTHNMNEDMKAIYDYGLMQDYLHRNDPSHRQSPSNSYQDLIESKARRSDPSYHREEDEYDKRISELKKKIEIARLEKELEELTKKKDEI